MNTVSFEVKPHGDFGGFSLSLDLSEDTNVDKVKITLKTLQGNLVEEPKEVILSELPQRRIEYSKNDIEDADNRLEPGTYHLLFEFFANTDPTPINQWESYICIIAQAITTAEINLNFNTVYTIDYVDETGNSISDWEAYNFSGTVITKYSARSNFTFPVLYKDGFIFQGWYETVNGTETKVSKINKGTSGNKTLKAKFIETVLYVSGMGYDNTAPDSQGHFGDGTESSPFETVNRACEYIISNGTPYAEWIIYIMGDVTGPNNSGKKAGQRTSSSDYAMTSIPETLTIEYAKSITLEGKTGLDSDNIPQDMINRGLKTISGGSGSPTGVALTIRTEVPVTIKNLKLANGYNSTTNNSSEAVYNIGGGLCIAAGASVCLEDGVMISHNTATFGGGIYNAGILYVHGSTVIGDPSKTTPASGYTGDNCSNYGSSYGGGIYNTGKLYLGYSSENTPAEWNGSIVYNFSPTGGAIYNTKDGEIIMNSGTLKYNTNGGSGAGGGAVYNYGLFTMKNGSIQHNKSNDTVGGGVYNGYNNSDGAGIFTFAGGTIASNTVSSSHSQTGYGGGVFNKGIMYVYGEAVIGDASKATGVSAPDSSDNCSNFAAGYGGGICVQGTGKLYLGYKNYTSETVNETAEWSGGIYYNYSANSGSAYTGGGGLAVKDSGTVIMNSGTIAKNNSLKPGTDVYFGSNGFTIGGSAKIFGEIYQYSSYTLNIADSLSQMEDGVFKLTPTSDDGKTKYYDNQPIIKLTDAAKITGVLLSDVIPKFSITPLITTSTGQTTNWIIDESTGKMKIKTSAGNTASFDIGAADIVVYRNGYGFTSPISATDTTGTITLDVKKVAGVDFSNSTMSLVWTFDGEVLTRDSMPEAVSFRYNTNDRQIDISSGLLSKGSYDVSVEATYNGVKYSFTTQIIKN